jgi:hypothetical protein
MEFFKSSRFLTFTILVLSGNNSLFFTSSISKSMLKLVKILAREEPINPDPTIILIIFK